MSCATSRDPAVGRPASNMSDILLIPGNMCDERLWGPVAKRLIACRPGRLADATDHDEFGTLSRSAKETRQFDRHCDGVPLLKGNFRVGGA